MACIVHIDLNAFFAQCEENANPSYKGHPLAVGEDCKRSVVSTANYEARKFGVHSAMPIFQAKQLCPNLILVPGHYHLYSSISKKFMSFLHERYEKMEIASIDETYIDMTGLIEVDEAYDYLFDLQLEIFQKLHLKCSIGCGSNKFVAKMCSDYKKPMGITVCNQKRFQEIFWKENIDKMWGVGKKTAPRLKEIGINTIGDLALNEFDEVKAVLGSSYETFHSWALGNGPEGLDTSSFNPKSISTATTLIEDSDDPAYLKDIMRSLLTQVVHSLKKYHKMADTLVLTLRDGKFSTHSKRQKMPLNDSFETMIIYANRLFDSFYQGQGIRLIGIGVESKDIVVNEDNSIDLFSQNTIKEEKKKTSFDLKALLDKVDSDLDSSPQEKRKYETK